MGAQTLIYFSNPSCYQPTKIFQNQNFSSYTANRQNTQTISIALSPTLSGIVNIII